MGWDDWWVGSRGGGSLWFSPGALCLLCNRFSGSFENVACVRSRNQKITAGKPNQVDIVCSMLTEK